MEQFKSFFSMLLIFGVIFMLFQMFSGNNDAAAPELPDRGAIAKSMDANIVTTDKIAKAVSIGSLDDEGGKGYKLQLNLTSTEAAIESAYLSEFFQTSALKRQARSGKPIDAADKGRYKLLTSVQWDLAIHRAMATRGVQVVHPATNTNFFQHDADWTFVGQTEAADKSSQSAVFELNYNRNKKPFLTLRKTYTLHKGSYSAEVTFEAINKTATPMAISFDQTGPVGMTKEDTRGDQRSSVVGLVEDKVIQPVMRGKGDLDGLGWDDSAFEQYTPNAANPYFQQRLVAILKAGGLSNADALRAIQSQTLPYLEAVKTLKEQYAEYRVDQTLNDDGTPEALDVAWTGVANKFFASYLYLVPPEGVKLASDIYHTQYYFKPILEPAPNDSDEPSQRAWMPILKFNQLALEPGKPMAMKFDLFCGPKNRTLFVDTPLYAKNQYASTVIPLGGCTMCTFEWLMQGLMWLLSFFATTLFFGNYGLAIILLVVIVRICLHPLTKKSQISMANMQKKMAVLKPKLDAIKEKYKSDPRKQQQEMMKVNKEHGMGAAQMLGCLPMFIQMPIWIALFSGLNTEVALRHAELMPVWITDLSVPDALFMLPASLQSGFVGNTFNLLPLLLCIAMYLQSKLNPSMSGATTPEQKTNQTMMKVMMPLMMLLFFYKAPSGLCLYIMSSTFAGVAEQIIIRKHLREQEELDGTVGEVVVTTGRGPRGSRPKKSKGPFQVKK